MSPRCLPAVGPSPPSCQEQIFQGGRLGGGTSRGLWWAHGTPSPAAPRPGCSVAGPGTGCPGMAIGVAVAQAVPPEPRPLLPRPGRGCAGQRGVGSASARARLSTCPRGWGPGPAVTPTPGGEVFSPGKCAFIACCTVGVVRSYWVWGCCRLASVLLHFPLPLIFYQFVWLLLSAEAALWEAEETKRLFLESEKRVRPKANAITSGCMQASEEQRRKIF